MYDLDLKKYHDLSNELILRKLCLPVETSDGPTPILFGLLNDVLLQCHEQRKLLLPNFHDTETVAVFSDYGGETNSKYFTYSFVFADYTHLKPFQVAMNAIRQHHKLDNPNKEIAFKSLRYAPVRNCIDDYLTAINNFVNGLVFTLIVSKDVVSLSGPNNKQTNEVLADSLETNGFGEWKPKIAEKMNRVTQVIAYWCWLLIEDGKKVFWMTDADAIVANPEKANQCVRLLQNWINSCKEPKEYSVFGYSPKPFDGDYESGFIDLLSLSDMISGSLDHFYKQYYTPSPQINPSAEKVLSWLILQGVGMKKINVEIKMDGANFVAVLVEFSEKTPSPNRLYFDYAYDVTINHG